MTKNSSFFGNYIMKKYYIYIMSNYSNSVLYVGVTNNLVRRIYEHKNKFVKGFAEKYNVNKLVCFEEYQDSLTAIEREKKLKAGSRQKKIDLVNRKNPDWNDLYDSLLG
jgi:putative endonuclease